jgi:hypothetical protein
VSEACGTWGPTKATTPRALPGQEGISRKPRPRALIGPPHVTLPAARPSAPTLTAVGDEWTDGNKWLRRSQTCVLARAAWARLPPRSLPSASALEAFQTTRASVDATRVQPARRRSHDAVGPNGGRQASPQPPGPRPKSAQARPPPGGRLFPQ